MTIEGDMLAELVVENRSVEVETLMHFFELEHFALTNFLLSAFKLVISDFNLFTLLSRFSHLLACLIFSFSFSLIDFLARFKSFL